MISKELEKILLRVEKPGRYVGGEHNQIRKEWDSVQTHLALIFPDIYDLGQANLGLAILYDLLNKRPDAAAERCYAPWVDMEERLREAKLALFSLENKRPLADFEILGFSLPYESIYTNVLNILDLAGIPLLSKDRNREHPLVIAGGQSCYNPEPMAGFIDAFVIGEGEEAANDIVNCQQSWQASGGTRAALLHQLAAIPGVYVPSLYAVSYDADGKVKDLCAQDKSVPSKVFKRIVPKLPPPPTRIVVPNIEIVHDRIAIEIMRGCTRGCRFCHAGVVNRPVRERPVEEVLQAIEGSLQATGYEEVGLLSLSSSDYTQILALTQQVHERFAESRIQVSLPSLRIASFSVELMENLKDLKPSGGFTLAPEAATERMRAVINKALDEEEFLETVRTIFEHGWLSIKLYFMVGLPSETMEDVQAIMTLARKVQQIGKKAKGGRIRVSLGIGSLIPKPHTPFQWAAMDSAETTREKLEYLRAEGFKSGIKVSFNKPDETVLEAWLSRGDRRLGRVIELAWQKGARFDAWSEHFNKQAWLEAFAEAGLEPDFYAARARDEAENLPWEHIFTGVKKEHLLREWQLSKLGKTCEDCRAQCYRCGVLDAYGSLRPAADDYYWGCP
ncbi:MAG: TIGR03960 family B12-binding radical SAM protein [Anaerolineaceae bacterium]|nr:TIGR03960 family B12-binding radical SAM protein [Anaerolineaceae bacterium]